MPYTTPAQDAARIRQVLRKSGITQRQVSIRSDRISLRIRINDPSVDIREVRNVSASYEKIDRDVYTGEILAGDNRFVYVDYSKAAAERFAEINSDLIAALIATAPKCTDSSTFAVGEWLLFRNAMDGNAFVLRRTDNSFRRFLYDLSPCSIAAAMLVAKGA